MTEQAGLFDSEGFVDLTLGDAPHVEPARAGFLAGMLATWFVDARPTPAQKETLLAMSGVFLAKVQETLRP